MLLPRVTTPLRFTLTRTVYSPPFKYLHMKVPFSSRKAGNPTSKPGNPKPAPAGSRNTCVSSTHVSASASPFSCCTFTLAAPASADASCGNTNRYSSPGDKLTPCSLQTIPPTPTDSVHGSASSRTIFAAPCSSVVLAFVFLSSYLACTRTMAPQTPDTRGSPASSMTTTVASLAFLVSSADKTTMTSFLPGRSSGVSATPRQSKSPTVALHVSRTLSVDPRNATSNSSVPGPSSTLLQKSGGCFSFLAACSHVKRTAKVAFLSLTPSGNTGLQISVQPACM